MSRSNSDNKFILYQILYIVILTIMVYKGAELTLSKVAESNVPEVASKMIMEDYKKNYENEKKINVLIRTENDKLKKELVGKILTANNEVPPPPVEFPFINQKALVKKDFKFINNNMIISNPVKKIFNQANNFVSNPTNQELFFIYDGKIILTLKGNEKNKTLSLTEGIKKHNNKNPQLLIKYKNPDTGQLELIDSVEVYDKPAIPGLSIVEDIYNGKSFSELNKMEQGFLSLAVQYEFPKDLQFEVDVSNPTELNKYNWFKINTRYITQNGIEIGKSCSIKFEGFLNDQTYSDFIDICERNGSDDAPGYRISLTIKITDKYSHKFNEITKQLYINGN
ncbi:MAG: hypothetical protein M1480_19105 [Bacteroidetes bacterium]|nr:hypothetical protein [Bacteroidota bacterium]